MSKRRETTTQPPNLRTNARLFPFNLPPQLTPEEEHELGLRALAGDNAARKQLVLNAVPFLIRYVKNLHAQQSDLDDAFQDGVLHVLKASLTWKPDKYSVRFISYYGNSALAVIVNALRVSPIGAHIAADTRMESVRRRRMIRDPHHVAPGLQKSDQALDRVDRLLFCRPVSISSHENFVDRTDLRTDRVYRSLEAALSRYDEDPDQQIDATTILKQGMRGLPKRLRSILRWHFGMTRSGREYTYREIGEKLGITAGRVQQLACVAMRKIETRLRVLKLDTEIPYAQPSAREQRVTKRHWPEADHKLTFRVTRAPVAARQSVPPEGELSITIETIQHLLHHKFTGRSPHRYEINQWLFHGAKLNRLEHWWLNDIDEPVTTVEALIRFLDVHADDPGFTYESFLEHEQAIQQTTEK